MKKYSLILVFLFLILGFVLRLYRFNNPIADWHSWRQADTSAVSKIFVQEDFDLLHPKYFDVSKVQSSYDNPQGLRYVEFPIYNILQAGGYILFPNLTLEEWGRMIAILSSISAGIFLYLLSRKYFGEIAALSALFFYMFLPFSIYYGRTVLPDTSMVAAILGAIYFFNLYLAKKGKINYLFFLLTIFFTASAFLLKPYALFFTLPMVATSWEKYKFKIFKRIDFYIIAVISLLPFALWRIWMQQYPEGIPYAKWLFNGGDIRFKGAYFYWIFGERISKLILGYFGISLVIIGILKREGEKMIVPLSFLASSLLYLVVMAKGNVQHDYYQILIVPTLAILAGRGVDYVLSLKDETNRKIGIAAILFIVFITLSLSWYFVRDYFNINNEPLVIAGKKADEILPKDAKVIAPYNGDTTLLYYINRRGWPVFQDSVENLKKMGATHMVIVSPTDNDRNGFGRMYGVLESSKDYLILKL